MFTYLFLKRDGRVLSSGRPSRTSFPGGVVEDQLMLCECYITTHRCMRMDGECRLGLSSQRSA